MASARNKTISGMPPTRTYKTISASSARAEENIEVVVQSAKEKALDERRRVLKEEPVLVQVQDHFTLPAASNLVRYRAKRNAARVFEANGLQLVLEEIYDQETDKSKISVRALKDATAGVYFLRVLYTLVCSLWTGFFFVFCMQLLLYLVLELGVASGATSIENTVSVPVIIGVVLAIIVLVRGFAEAMVIAGHYIADIWTGHFLVKKFFLRKFFGDVTIEWAFFAMFLGIPTAIMSIGLLMQYENWWSITILTWFCLVMGFFMIFCVNVVLYEVKAAYDFSKNRSDTDNDTFIKVINRCILLRQIHTYSGKTRHVYLSRNCFTDTEATEDLEKAHVLEHTRQVTTGWWARVTKFMPSFLYTQLDTPERLFTIEDVQDYRPFLTRNTWSLERIFCRPRNSRYIAIVNGPGALSPSQIRSSVACSILGTALIVLMCVSFLLWLSVPVVYLAIASALCVLVGWPLLKNVCNIYGVARDLVNARANKGEEHYGDEETTDARRGKPKNDQEDSAANRRASVDILLNEGWSQGITASSEAVYLVSEYKRLTKARECFCWIMFFLELGIFVAIPMTTLWIISWNLAIFFAIVSSISSLRYYINALVIIEETGDMGLVGGATPSEQWEKKSRLNEIVAAITTSKTRQVWVTILGLIGFGFLGIFLSAVGTSTESTARDEYRYLPNHYYPAQSEDMRYPTCTLSNMNGGFGSESTLADFAFMASSAYFSREDTQTALDSWFLDVEAVDSQDIVDEFRSREDPKNETAVYFKLYTFPAQSLAVIVVRGTDNNWDMLADSQLWSAASLMKGLRAVLPLGEIFTPIFDELVGGIHKLESQTVERVSFYKLTTKFALELQENDQFDTVQITGHSLGGGLSIITGAQAKIPAISLSGPSAMISGRSFDPPIAAEDLNKYTFNIVPKRDPIPMLEDEADQFQSIRCEASFTDFVGCHYARRSLCEIMYTCGSAPNRPALCHCHLNYGYPKPLPTGDDNFDEACGNTTNF